MVVRRESLAFTNDTEKNKIFTQYEAYSWDHGRERESQCQRRRKTLVVSGTEVHTGGHWREGSFIFDHLRLSFCAGRNANPPLVS